MKRTLRNIVLGTVLAVSAIFGGCEHARSEESKQEKWSSEPTYVRQLIKEHPERFESIEPFAEDWTGRVGVKTTSICPYTGKKIEYAVEDAGLWKQYSR